MERKDSIIGIYFVTFWIYITLFIWTSPFLELIFFLDDLNLLLPLKWTAVYILYLSRVWSVILNLLKLDTYELIILSESFFTNWYLTIFQVKCT